MRNFSCINVTRFVSYSINMGEYEGSVDTLKVLTALAVAFESPLSSVIEDFNNLTDLNGEAYGFEPKLCMSEFDVLRDLYEYVRNLGCRRPKGTYEHAENFVYINLNTGASVVWSHMVC